MQGPVYYSPIVHRQSTESLTYCWSYQRELMTSEDSSLDRLNFGRGAIYLVASEERHAYIQQASFYIY